MSGSKEGGIQKKVFGRMGKFCTRRCNGESLFGGRTTWQFILFMDMSMNFGPDGNPTLANSQSPCLYLGKYIAHVR